MTCLYADSVRAKAAAELASLRLRRVVYRGKGEILAI